MNTVSFPGTVSTSNSIGPLFARLFRFIGVVQSIVLDGTTPVSNRNLLRCLLWLLDRYLFCILPSCMISNGLVFYHREPSIGRICRAGTNPNRVFALENWTKIYRNLMWSTSTSSTSETSEKVVRKLWIRSPDDLKLQMSQNAMRSNSDGVSVRNKSDDVAPEAR